MSADTINFEIASADERQYPCEGWVIAEQDERACPIHVTRRDTRDDALYCKQHAEAIQLYGVDGTRIKMALS